MKKVFKCQLCGYIYQDAEAPGECPVCHSSKDFFLEMDLAKMTKKDILDSFKLYVKWSNATAYQEQLQLNPSAEMVDQLAERELIFLKEKGQAYCPCRLLSGREKADRKIICPCVYSMGEVELDGKCKCGLFTRAGT